VDTRDELLTRILDAAVPTKT